MDILTKNEAYKARSHLIAELRSGNIPDTVGVQRIVVNFSGKVAEFYYCQGDWQLKNEIKCDRA